MKGLFLDDERNPEDVYWINYPDNIEWTIVREGSTFVEMSDIYNTFDVISFDHDINSDMFDGYILMQHLLTTYSLNVQNKGWEDLPECIFHTQNPVGEVNMRTYLMNFKKHVWDVK